MNLEDIMLEKMAELQSNLPPLPIGWEYDYSFNLHYNDSLKGFEVTATATPRQKFILAD